MLECYQFFPFKRHQSHRKCTQLNIDISFKFVTKPVAMKLQEARQLPFQHASVNNRPKVAFALIFLTVLLLVVISPPFQNNPASKISGEWIFSDRNGPPQVDIDVAKKVKGHHQETCDLFSGEWIPDPEGPYYTNETCHAMHGYQNCMKYGKPDTGYLRWRWKPDGCELPMFDPNQFLEFVRGKSIAFVGDSMARNQMQSLGCLLTRVVDPVDVSPADHGEGQDWAYKDYNFNMSLLWSPFLVRAEGPAPVKLYLDEYDEGWTAKAEGYDYIIISAGWWFLYGSMYYENGSLVSCYGCDESTNVTHTTPYFGYEKAFRTALRAINSLAKSKALIFIRTTSPSHFEGGDWNGGGDCIRTRPFKRNETIPDFSHFSKMREIQIQEYGIAEEEGRRRGLRFRLLDVTQSMLLRPDGHPRNYGHVDGINDCLHWCLPGPVDAWNDLLLQLFKREETKG